MAEPLYVIAGATGNVGGTVARRLLEQSRLLGTPRKVRVISRSAKRLGPLLELGAEPAVGSLEDVDFLTRTLAGATAFFAMIPPNPTVVDLRTWQDHVADAMARAIEAADVRYVVALSSLGAQLSGGAGPVNGLHDMEQRFRQLPDANVLFLRAGYFMENHLESMAAVKKLGVLPGALRPDLPMAMIATRDIGEVAARRLSALDFQYKGVLELTGPRDVTMQGVAAAVGRAIGKPDLKYVQVPYDEAKRSLTAAGLPEEQAELYMEMSRGFNDGLLEPMHTRVPQQATATSIEEFANELARAYERA